MEDQRIISPERRSGDEGDAENTLRPPSLAEFTGQKSIKESLSIAIEAARHRGDALDHCLFLVLRDLVRRLWLGLSPRKWA